MIMHQTICRMIQACPPMSLELQIAPGCGLHVEEHRTTGGFAMRIKLTSVLAIALIITACASLAIAKSPLPGKDSKLEAPSTILGSPYSSRDYFEASKPPSRPRAGLTASPTPPTPGNSWIPAPWRQLLGLHTLGFRRLPG